MPIPAFAPVLRDGEFADAVGLEVTGAVVGTPLPDGLGEGIAASAAEAFEISAKMAASVFSHATGIPSPHTVTESSKVVVRRFAGSGVAVGPEAIQRFDIV